MNREDKTKEMLDRVMDIFNNRKCISILDLYKEMWIKTDNDIDILSDILTDILTGLIMSLVVKRKHVVFSKRVDIPYQEYDRVSDIKVVLDVMGNEVKDYDIFSIFYKV